MNTTTADTRKDFVCSVCGGTSGTQQKIENRWLCLGCIFWLASWAIEHGALLTIGE